MATKKKESMYQRHLQQFLDGGNWFVFFRPYTKVISKLASLFLQDLINIVSGPNSVRKKVNGKKWCKCTVAYLENSAIGWSVEEQRHHFETLTEKGFVETKRMERDGVRWVHVSYRTIEKALNKIARNGDDENDLGSGETNGTGGNGFRSKTRKRFRGNERINKYKGNKEKGSYAPCPPAADRPSVPTFSAEQPTPHPKERALARYFKEQLAANHRIVKAPNLTKWAKEFVLLRKFVEDRNGVADPLKYIRKVIDHHIDSLHLQYEPTADCAASFREKFVKIEGAHERQDNPLPANFKPEYVHA